MVRESHHRDEHYNMSIPTGGQFGSIVKVDQVKVVSPGVCHICSVLFLFYSSFIAVPRVVAGPSPTPCCR